MGATDQERGRLEDAERNLRLALEAMEPNRSGGTELEEVRLAEVLYARGGRSRLEEADALLEKRATDQPLFVASRFRLCLAAVRVSLALGRPDRAAEWASSALTLAGATHSGLARHPRLGLLEVEADMHDWLTSVADG